MGLILDSSVLIAAERQGQNARQMLSAIARRAGETEIALSVVTLIELAHDAARADTAQRKAKAPAVYPGTTHGSAHPSSHGTGRSSVGQIDGENQAKGLRLPLADLLIGVTAFGTRLQRSHWQSPPLPANPRLVCGATLVHVTRVAGVTSLQSRSLTTISSDARRGSRRNSLSSAPQVFQGIELRRVRVAYLGGFSRRCFSLRS